MSVLDCKMAAVRVPVLCRGDEVDLGFLKVNSKNLSCALGDSGEAFVFAVTLGMGVERMLARLSKITSYDYSYLSRYFKKNIGISFVSYVMHYRLSHACYLLQNTTQSIARCAFESGFSSLRTFNRAFKENIKISPNQYRKNISL